MPSTNALLAFAVASTILVAVPGPSVLFVIGRSLALGRRAGLLSVVGNTLGVLVQIAAVAFGIGAAIAGSALLFTVVKLLGAAYLAHLGVQAIRHRRLDVSEQAVATGPRDTPAARVLWQGFVVGVTNPKAIVFFVAVLPQFVDVGAGNVPLQMAVLGTVFAVVAVVCDGTWALLAGTARSWFSSSPRRMARVRATGGGLMLALSGTLLTASRQSP
ncbi:LysE family translocator [Ornithinicoccus halotolerans]|uniref:LysE family translocator n=1 Tax=Ornithinicoccus halotolerans TaxID=1748220 RepID=UPI0012972FF9|nr:LysE family translocator [Ornithinicoccus halotolerans]